VPGRNILSHDLPNLKGSQSIDQPGAKNKADEKSGQNGTDRPKRNIPEDIQIGECRMEGIEKMVEHLFSPLH
jgi:hypothetical protein